jgi:hypothetical protein
MCKLELTLLSSAGAMLKLDGLWNCFSTLCNRFKAMLADGSTIQIESSVMREIQCL